MHQNFLRAMALTALALLAPMAAFAQGTYPSQAIKFIVPYPAGGATDTLARTVAQKLNEAWSQPVVIENKAGASGTIGNQFVTKAPADGYTVLVAITALIQQPSLMDKLGYDPLKDLTPVTMIARSPSMLAVPVDSQVKTLKDYIALAKSQPGKINYGTYGAGTSAHIQGSLLAQQAGLELIHVPFNGAAPLVTNLVGGQLTSAFIDSASARPHLPKLRALAVTGTARIPGMPDVPTFQELGYHSFDPYGWFALLVPAGTPPAVVNKLSVEVNRILKLPDVTAKIEGLGLQVGGGTPDDMAKVMRNDSGIYAKIIKDAGIKLAQ